MSASGTAPNNGMINPPTIPGGDTRASLSTPSAMMDADRNRMYEYTERRKSSWMNPSGVLGRSSAEGNRSEMDAMFG